MTSYHGRTPAIDGVLAPGEWDDATPFAGVRDWVPQFSPVTSDADLALRGFVKHDDRAVYFAFAITDDLLYGLDTPRWLPKEHPRVHELTPAGFPWFGDAMEILVDAPRTRAEKDSEGSGASWQMVCNLTKSRLGGIGKGGLLEGEPRVKPAAFATYRRWIDTGAQTCAARRGPGGYVIEWAIRFEPCVEVAPGRFYAPAQGETIIGLNIALADLDQPVPGNFGGFHHEQWLAGAKNTRTKRSNFASLRIMGRQQRPR